MKIGIITFHFVSNQGAVLQCYALQTYLKNMGHDVEVINYRPDYHASKYKIWKNPYVIAKNNWNRNKGKKTVQRFLISCKVFSKTLIQNVKRNDKRKYIIFQEFTNQFLNQSNVYKSVRQLQEAPPCDDVYISGSDQLWNLDLLGSSFDDAYFLNFGNEGIRKITYAVSAKEHYSDSEKAKISVLSRSLNAISLRETNQDVLESVNKPVKITIDPTLLLDKKDYQKIAAERIESSPYLFVYGFENLKSVDEAVKEISTTLDLKVINGSPNRIKLSINSQTVNDYGPREFLSYIANAEYVVTNSFHGTAFSIIMQRPFVVVPHSTRGKRMVELLEKLGIKNRIWTENCDWKQPINYDSVYFKLSELRESSEDFLLKELHESTESIM